MDHIKKAVSLFGWLVFSFLATGLISLPKQIEQLLAFIFGLGDPNNFGQGLTFVGGALLVLILFVFKDSLMESSQGKKSTPKQLSERWHSTYVFFILLGISLLLFVPYTLIAYSLNESMTQKPFFIWLYIFLALNCLQHGFMFIPRLKLGKLPKRDPEAEDREFRKLLHGEK
ncbi:MAG TPA: hypothetical protein VJI13_01970 [Candidatus Norongarragalinales archaeon]|nr:hypothetical protein [Candidatus Norongarragalinales archaeon]